MNWLRQTFEISHSNHKTNRSMEGLRGCAVFMVFLVHYVALCEPWLLTQGTTYQIAMSLRDIGHAGVDLFFVLSGYLIYGTLIKARKPFLPYLGRRVQRIYPTFLVVFALYLVLSLEFPGESRLPTLWEDRLLYIVQNLLLLPGIFDIPPLIIVAWSLSYEFFFYLLLPLLITTLSMHRWPRPARIVFFLLLSALGFLYSYFQGDYIRLLMFIAGIILFEIVDGKLVKSLPVSGVIWFVLACTAMVAVEQLEIPGWWRYLALYVFFFGLCLEAFTSSGLTLWLLSFTPLRWFGNISYSYYLIHGLSLKAAFLAVRWVAPPDGSGTAVFWLLFGPMLLASLIPSAVLFVLVEKPFSLSPRKRPKAAPTFAKVLQPAP